MYDMANEETREMVDSILAQIKEKRNHNSPSGFSPASGSFKRSKFKNRSF